MIRSLIQQLRATDSADIAQSPSFSSPVTTPLRLSPARPSPKPAVSVNDVSVELFLKQLLSFTRRKAELDLWADYRCVFWLRWSSWLIGVCRAGNIRCTQAQAQYLQQLIAAHDSDSIEGSEMSRISCLCA